MTLELPADLEPHLTAEWDQMRDPAVYALTLTRPDNIGEVWDETFDTRPEWFDEFRAADEVVYVGATNDALTRLEDHRDGEVRTAVLLRVCDIRGLRNLWWFETADEAFQNESKLALWMQQQYPRYYVHSR